MAIDMNKELVYNYGTIRENIALFVPMTPSSIEQIVPIDAAYLTYLKNNNQTF